MTLFFASVIIFAATQALPGDPARAILGRSATPESLAELQRQLGLDKPVTTQYWDWISGVFTGDLGSSLATRLPVTELIGERIVNSLFLMLIAAIITSRSGSRSARQRRAAATGSSTRRPPLVTLGLAALPEFVVGIALAVLFATTVFTFLPA